MITIIEDYLDRYIIWVRRVFRNHLGLGYWFYLMSIMIPFGLLWLGFWLWAVAVLLFLLMALLVA